MSWRESNDGFEDLLKFDIFNNSKLEDIGGSVLFGSVQLKDSIKFQPPVPVAKQE